MPEEPITKPWHQSFTIWFNTLVVVALVAPELAQLPELAAYRDELALIAAVANIIIRVFKTNTAIKY